MMRILAITNLYPNPSEPQRAPFNRLQLGALASQHKVELIAPIAWTRQWAFEPRTPQHARSIGPDRRRISDGMVVHHPQYFFTPKVLRGWYGQFYLRSIRACFREALARFRPDIVLASWAYPDGWAGVRLARDAGLPVAIKVHGSDVLTLAASSARRRRTIEALTGADAVIAVGTHLASAACALGVDPNRLHVVRNGVDGAVFRPGDRAGSRKHLGIVSGEPLVLFVGNLVRVKGPDLLVEALAEASRRGLRFHAAILGAGPLHSRLQERIGALTLGDRVRLVGPQPHAQLVHWYRAADLLVVPSLSEGVPNVVLEAAACGTPCIASRVGGVPEIVGPESLVPAGDVPTLADRISAFLLDPARRSSSPILAPPSWSESARALASVLQSITHDASARLASAA